MILRRETYIIPRTVKSDLTRGSAPRKSISMRVDRRARATLNHASTFISMVPLLIRPRRARNARSRAHLSDMLSFALSLSPPLP